MTASNPVPGLGRLHLLLLHAGARLIQIVGRRRAWSWTSRLTIALAVVFRKPARVVFTVFGSRYIEVTLSDNYWIPSILLGHGNEPEVHAVLSRVLTPDSFFIDAGANIGWWSLFASTIIADPARIIAIEPAASTFADLVRNAQLNGMAFQCMRAAVWSAAGEEVSLRFSEAAREAAHVAWEGTLWDQPSAQTEMVPSVTVGEIAGSAPESKLAVLKLDVEGSELAALAGAGKYARAFDLIIYEDHGKDPKAMVTAEILRLGYSVFAADRAGGLQAVASVASAQRIKPNPRLGYNFFAVRPGSLAEVRLGVAAANRPGAAGSDPRDTGALTYPATKGCRQ